MAKKKTTYKSALEELEGIIKTIEAGEPDVDELGVLVKRAAILIQECKQKLKNTEEDLAQTLEDIV